MLDRSAEAPQKVETSVRGAGGEGLAIPYDVSSPDQVEAAIKQLIDRFSRVDIAFNNAAWKTRRPPSTRSISRSGTEFSGSTCVARWSGRSTSWRRWLSRAGVLVNTSSGAGIRGVAGGAAYAASKHAIIGLTRSVALDYAKQNIPECDTATEKQEAIK